MQKLQSDWSRALIGAMLCVAISSLVTVNAAETVLHAFRGGKDGASPYYGGLISDRAGDTFGTTGAGGSGGCSGGCGTVYKLTKDQKESVLYAFKGGSDGEEPMGALLLDASGNLYGTTKSGGGTGCGGSGCGTVFRLAPNGTEAVLYAFQGGSDGYSPEGNVLEDQSGNLYGTTSEGGTFNSACADGCGTIFEVQPDTTKITLYEFQGGSDGEGPSGALSADGAGNLYGTTYIGGGCNCGTVFEVSPNGQESILHAFQGSPDGTNPYGGVTLDSDGNLYGTTAGGGASCCGSIFRVPAGGGSDSVLYSFSGGPDGLSPVAGVVRDSKGNLYGTTGGGGEDSTRAPRRSGSGTVFELTPNGTLKPLFTFRRKYGQFPQAPVLLGKDGAIYGTTTAGGAHNDGVVFEVTK